jgi:methionyl-tRNA formyltransferase
MKIIFAGTPDFAVPTLQMLQDSKHQICAVYTQPDRPAGRGRKLKPGPVKALALQAGMTVCQPDTLNTREEQEKLLAYDADLMVVIAYGLILSQSVLDVPRLGCVNVHASLLPRWRGAAPIQRALIAGDETTGVTIMQVERKLDAGAMLHKERCQIGAKETASQLHDRLAVLGATGLAKVLPSIESGTCLAEQQDENLVTFAEKMTKSEAVLDWTQKAVDLERKIRGLNAWPVAQTLYKNKVLRVWQAEVLAENVGVGPGIVLESKNKQFDVATGQGVLRLLEIQLPGGKRMNAQAFLNAHNVEGVCLGK